MYMSCECGRRNQILLKHQIFVLMVWCAIYVNSWRMDYSQATCTCNFSVSWGDITITHIGISWYRNRKLSVWTISEKSYHWTSLPNSSLANLLFNTSWVECAFWLKISETQKKYSSATGVTFNCSYEMLSAREHTLHHISFIRLYGANTRPTCPNTYP